MVHLSHCVRDGRASREHYATSAALLHYLLRLDVHIVGALRARRIAANTNPLHLCREHQIFELVRLINEQRVHTKLGQVKQIVHWLLTKGFDSLLQLFTHLGQLLHGTLGSAVPAVLFLDPSTKIVDGVGNLLDLRPVEFDLEFHRRLDKSKRAVCNDYRVPVAGGNLGHESAAVLPLKIVLRGGQHLGARVQPVEV